MGQSQLVITLLSLLVVGLGAIAAWVTYDARNASRDDVPSTSGIDEVDRVELAHRRREFMKRYPTWASRDFQNDRQSPWYTDPDFSEVTRTARR